MAFGTLFGVTRVRAFFAVAPSAASKSAGGTFVVDLPVGERSLLGPKDAIVIDTTRVGMLVWDGIRVTLTASLAESVFVAGKRLDGAMEILPGDDIGVRGHHLVLGIAAPFSSPQNIHHILLVRSPKLLTTILSLVLSM